MKLRDLIKHKFDDAFHLQGRLVGSFLKQLKELGCSKRQEVIAIAKEVYDVACKTIDIPFVGETTEAQWEQEFWSGTVLPILNRVADASCGPVPADQLSFGSESSTELGRLPFGKG